MPGTSNDNPEGRFDGEIGASTTRGRWYAPVVAFFYLWLVVGFFTGTVLLVGPVQWITRGARAAGLARLENAVMIAVIVLFVTGSFLLTRWLLRRTWRHDRRLVRLGVPVLATMAAAASLYAWLNPSLLAGAAGGFGGTDAPAALVAVGEGAEFHFGPYPDEAKLVELKQEGFAAVISLQHPAVLPFEPPGIEREKRRTAELDIEFIHAPMVPWVSSNEASLERIREVARTRTGKFYVHCGLGRDRTNVVKRMLQRMQGARVLDVGGAMAATSFRDRQEPLERGRAVEVAPDIWLIPYPNEHEIYGNMLAGQVASVVSLLDPADSTQAAWNATLARTFREYAVPFAVRPVRTPDTAAAAAAAEYALRLPRPVVVIAPYTQPEAADTRVADAFERALRASGRGQR